MGVTSPTYEKRVGRLVESRAVFAACRRTVAIQLSLHLKSATHRHVVTRKRESVSVYQVGPSVSRAIAQIWIPLRFAF